MIYIAIIFGCLAYMEWRYLKRKKRTKRTFRIVMGLAAILFLGTEVLYLIREQWTLSSVIEAVFGRLQEAIMIKK